LDGRTVIYEKLETLGNKKNPEDFLFYLPRSPSKALQEVQKISQQKTYCRYLSVGLQLFINNLRLAEVNLARLLWHMVEARASPITLGRTRVCPPDTMGMMGKESALEKAPHNKREGAMRRHAVHLQPSKPVTEVRSTFPSRILTLRFRYL